MDVIMPQLGETVLEGSVLTWYKKPGDNVQAGEPLFEVETEKVTTEIPAPASGLLTERHTCASWSLRRRWYATGGHRIRGGV